MRLFLALDLDAPAKTAIAASTAELRAQWGAPGFSWTAAEKLHLTLRFLGEQPERAISMIAPAMEEVARKHRPFAMRLRQVGAFPNFRRARVVWMGVDPDPRLELLHHDVEVACDGLGFGLEGRPFRPHVTLARVRGTAGEDVMRPFARMAKRVEFEREVMVNEIVLMHSRSTGNGTTYDRLHAAPMRQG